MLGVSRQVSEATDSVSDRDHSCKAVTVKLYTISRVEGMAVWVYARILLPDH